MRNGAEALALHVEDWAEQGWTLPSPSPLDAALDAAAEPAARVLIPLDEPSRAQRVEITFPDQLLERIDRAAERRGLTRSGFLAEGARDLLAREDSIVT